MNSYSILIVEDEIDIARAIEAYLNNQGYKTFMAGNGIEGLEVLSNEEIHLAIVDVMMPKMDGITFVMKLREKYDFPVIMLSAKSEEVDKIMGLNIGADDYVTKPFSPKILVAKVKALLKRTADLCENQSSTKNYNGLTINKLSHEIKVNNVQLALSPKEYELLVYLSDNIGIALTRDTILDNVWGIDYYGDLRTVDTNIKRLREKLGEKANYIITVRGSGYKFDVNQ